MIKNEKGQSTIEFIMSFTFILSILFLFIRVTITLSNGYFVHYATFMASRAMLVHETNSADPNNVDRASGRLAEEVFLKYNVESFIGEDSAGELKTFFSGDLGGSNVFRGVSYTFLQKVGISSLVGGTEPIEMVSESFLGKEPTRQECLSRIIKMIEDVSGLAGGTNATYFDNGC